jgi:hypothetical protein
MEYALLRCVRAALLDARSISKLLLRDAQKADAICVNPSSNVHTWNIFRSGGIF